MENINQLLEGHSQNYREMALQSDQYQPLRDADGYGKRTGQCGDTVEMYLRISNDTIQEVGFQIEGCLNTNACANTLAYMAKGKCMDDAWNLTSSHIIDYLETLPPHENHCADLACGAFYLALKNAQDHKQTPWKKQYQRSVPL
ncbi:MAG: NifU domain-containing protein [Candidatus Magnetoglobus multicellularis str. Araruama]|uniref:NifU domain-containing protein n=1 Tax=Candidatus Magnetoglobus multicellularis str. Araruama TaxID=890399 RepID=A0A1V1PGP2_9BACT|nr:MAG: NifU domain-containing protein [Candidatus Magnetoglobus multicellularis str. Araruama]